MIATETQAKAKDVSSRVLEAATGLIEWAGKYPDHVQSDPASLLRDVSGLRRRARVIRKACERPASIAIYGESQSGKSNLVSTIARGRNDTVRVQFGANEFDFMADLDPGGGRESTGLVTRFSAKAAPATRTDLPVYLELLTELDIVTIFSRTFFTGISQKQTDSASESAVQSVLADLKAQRHRGAASHLHGDDVVALRETVNTDYETAGKLTSLNAAFWNDIESLLPDLPLHGRLRFYSLLWLDDPHLSAAAKHLLGILEALGHAQGVLAGIDAIQPRDKSIVDVENLSGFATEMDTSLTVMTVDGQRQTSVGRATLCALTAEIYMQLTAAPGGAMDSCDLLDFPGARNPEPMNSVDEAIAAQKPDDPLDGVAKLYLRGKVDVLFQKYARNQDLAAVVLCRRPDTSNVPGLKHTIYDWISTTLGSSPAARTGVNTLFVVFTLADLVLLPKRGELPPEERLATVIESHFTKYFNNFPSDLWPTQWDRHGPFQNCHWYRNPLVGDSPLFDRKEQSGVLVETGIAPAYAERLETWRRAFLNTDAVARHFVSPDAAWDSLVGPNDGGATHLAQRLAETVNPATKFNLLLERIVEIATELKDRIDEHRVSDDLAVER
ncbi:MAG: virulence factor SrfC family protein, partial [Pseudomonadota bacterium]